MTSNTQLAFPDDSFLPQPFGQMSRSMQRHTKRGVQRVTAQGLVAYTHEQLRAALANIALQNTGALSALEEHLIQIAPSGALRYKHIVDAYALGAAQKIARW